ncbi:hypothetical protein [Collimonas arenae]|uniref:hypothetical protein n=1 Tax=Collimonas arenae TaxID=279058 RepID=UPI000B161FFF|nr:hypothetical protein [Collimonas arenae]
MTSFTTARFHRIKVDFYQYGRVTFDRIIICALVAVVCIGVFSGARKLAREPAVVRSSVLRSKSSRLPAVGGDYPENPGAPALIKGTWSEEPSK